MSRYIVYRYIQESNSIAFLCNTAETTQEANAQIKAIAEKDAAMKVTYKSPVYGCIDSDVIVRLSTIFRYEYQPRLVMINSPPNMKEKN